MPLKFDRIGYWSELKLEIVEKYGSAYTTAFKNTKLKKYYIDGFSGAGVHLSKQTGTPIEGSPARALGVFPPFDGFHFIDIDPHKTGFLSKKWGGRSNVSIHTGDCSEILTKKLLPAIQYQKFNRALCLLDPYGLHLDWEVMLLAGRSRAVDMFLNFPVMDMNRNAIWRNPSSISQSGLGRMTKYWGDESWKKVAYTPSPQSPLFGEHDMVKQTNEEIVAAFRERLQKVAGFAHVADPLPMKNTSNTVVYYLFLASPKSVAEKIIKDIFSRYR